MQDGLRMSGVDTDLTEEEYKNIFTRFVKEGGEVAYHFKSIAEMTAEEIVDHMEFLRQASMRIKISSQAAKVTLESKKIHLSQEEREALRLRDLAYKPKKQDSPEKPKRAKKASSGTNMDPIEFMMKMLGLTREQAEKRLAKVVGQVGNE